MGFYPQKTPSELFLRLLYRYNGFREKNHQVFSKTLFAYI